jgi:hypothetical protein
MLPTFWLEIVDEGSRFRDLGITDIKLLIGKESVKVRSGLNWLRVGLFAGFCGHGDGPCDSI